MGTKRTKTGGPVIKAPKSNKTAPKRKVVTRVTEPTSRKKPVTAAKAVEISQEMIALRAYFIAEKRNAAGIQGDPLSDWLEAERQLRAEL